MGLKTYHPFIIHPRGMRKNAQKTSSHIKSRVKFEKFKLGLKKKRKRKTRQLSGFFPGF